MLILPPWPRVVVIVRNGAKGTLQSCSRGLRAGSGPVFGFQILCLASSGYEARESD